MNWDVRRRPKSESSSLDAMTGTVSDDAERCWQSGDCVRIRCGSLEGLSGTVTRLAAMRKCVLTIDGLGPGVLVIVAGDALEPTEAQSSQTQ
jgi:hypothetical protein